MQGEPWRMHHEGVIIEGAARRRQPGGGSQEASGGTQEAPEGTQESLRGTQVAASRHPNLYLCLYLCQFCYLKKILLKARGACVQHGSI